MATIILGISTPFVWLRRYHNYLGKNINDNELKSIIFAEVNDLLLSGRSKRNERSGQVEEKSQKMAGATKKDKKMPQHMVVPHLLADIEEDSPCIAQATRQ
jgi:hypothetical protein